MEKIKIHSASNDNNFKWNIVRFREDVANAAWNFLIPESEIKRVNSENLEQAMWDILEFQGQFNQYIHTQGTIKEYSESENDIIWILQTFYDWKNIHWDYLNHYSIIWTYEAINKNIEVIGKILLWKLNIENDIIEWSDPWDRIAWEVKIRNKKEA